MVGSKTFGKGLVQTTRPLTYNSQLKVTTAKYYIPSGRCIQALDYAHRNEDGSVDKFADSLKSEFKTKKGRLVYDGAGLDPDLSVKRAFLSPITISLVSKGLVFNYATEFYYKNKDRITSTSFELTESDFNNFKSWLKDKDYDYTTSVERTLETLEKSAKEEKYYDDISEELKKLKAQVLHNKESDLETFKMEIEQIVREEIISREFFEKGSIQASFKSDESIETSVELLRDKSRYSQYLSRQ